MMQIDPGVGNRLWLLRAMVPWRGFQAASADPRGAQLRRLRSILRWNADCRYGRRYGFADISSLADFRKKVPAVRYDDLGPELEEVRRGGQGILTSEPVLMLQPSSGSTAATKLIPYTARLRREFNRAVSVWVADLFWNRPALMDGPAYWSLSPAVPAGPEEPGAVSVGFDDDSSYLGGVARALVASVLAMPEEVGRIPDPEVHRYATLRFLLGEPDLRLISVWSPTFLSLLLEPLARWWERLLEDVERGGMRPPAGGGRDGAEPLAVDARLPRLQPDPLRARALRAVDPRDLVGIWPRLGLLSAWADGPSAPYAQDLRRRFPGVPFQAKGLIATEAFVTIPRWGLPGCHPAITSHFLEFLPEGASEAEAFLVDELAEGERYEVLVTTGGGLYRYRLGDMVEVVGRGEGLPCLRFAGRVDRVSDRFGEKLSDGFVTFAVQEVCADEELEPHFSLLAPEEEAGRTRYVWYLDPGCLEGNGWEGRRRSLSRRLEGLLSRNFHYATCRRLGQLGPVEVRAVPAGAALRYLETKGEGGCRLGDVKIPALEVVGGWNLILRGPGNGSRPIADGRPPWPPGPPGGWDRGPRPGP